MLEIGDGAEDGEEAKSPFQNDVARWSREGEAPAEPLLPPRRLGAWAPPSHGFARGEVIG